MSPDHARLRAAALQPRLDGRVSRALPSPLSAFPLRLDHAMTTPNDCPLACGQIEPAGARASPCRCNDGPERSAAWLAHQSGGLGVGSSNLPAPTNKIK